MDVPANLPFRGVSSLRSSATLFAALAEQELHRQAQQSFFWSGEIDQHQRLAAPAQQTD